MATAYSATLSSAPAILPRPEAKTKYFALAAAAIGTVAGAFFLGRIYAISASGLWAGAYLIHSCMSPSKEPVKMQNHSVWWGGARPMPFRAVESARSPQPGSMISQKMQEYGRPGVIRFYDHTDPATGWLGNFYEVPVQFNNLVFRNSEAAFQAQKFIHHPQLMRQFTTLTGDQAFRLAQNNSVLIRPDWINVRVQTMTDVLQSKVAQHPEIAEWLLATGEAYLVEHNPVKGRDVFWSDDSDGSGQNMLGKLWMQVRYSLGGSGVVSQVAALSIPVNRAVAQQTQKAAQQCLFQNCFRQCFPGEFFCSITHGRAFERIYLQQKKSGYNLCDYPDCGNSRVPGFHYCSRSHGLIMEDWKRKNQIS